MLVTGYMKVTLPEASSLPRLTSHFLHRPIKEAPFKFTISDGCQFPTVHGYTMAMNSEVIF